jgi:hypothetical protein
MFSVYGSDTKPNEERKSCGSVHAIQEAGPAKIFQKDGIWCMELRLKIEGKRKKG